ncbi:MAG TPA: superoxide dismutase family protein [Mycobacterium sp.]|nr:superoxide dismutase family protein [Mycobacterium sp.]
MSKPLIAVLLVTPVAVALVGGCSTNKSGTNQTTSTSGTAAPPGTQRLTTDLKTSDGHDVATATLDFANGFATVTVKTVAPGLLTPGFHGLHVHAVGKCEGDYTSAGDHYQAQGHTGNPASGDLSPLQVRSDGAGELVTTTNAFTAQDLQSGAGTALILHQGADTVAASDSGKRLACGVISSGTASTSTSTSTVTSVVPVPGTTAATTSSTPVTTTTTTSSETTSTTTSPTTSTTSSTSSTTSSTAP